MKVAALGKQKKKGCLHFKKTNIFYTSRAIAKYVFLHLEVQSRILNLQWTINILFFLICGKNPANFYLRLQSLVGRVTIAVIAVVSKLGQRHPNCPLLSSKPIHYTPGICAKGVIVFAFPLGGVCTTVCGIYHKVFYSWRYVKVLKWDIFHEPLIREHSYLEYRYPGQLIP